MSRQYAGFFVIRWKWTMKKDKVLSYLIGAVSLLLYGAGMAFTLLENRLVVSELIPMLEGMLSFQVAFLFAYYLQIIVHEGGHLVFGLLSGYRFLSFRIGDWTLMKKEDGFSLKRYHLAGTLGQCLMAPPELKDGKYPCTLYHLGGVLMNLIVVLLCVLIRTVFPLKGFFNSFINMSIVTGIVMILNNGIPLKTELVSNDGYNALYQKKDRRIALSNWMTLKIYELQCQGVRMKDMDENWFAAGEGSDLNRYDEAVKMYYRHLMAMDKHDFDKADEFCDELLKDDSELSGILRDLLSLDRIYLDLIRKGSAADLSLLEEKKMKGILRTMKDHPSILRVLYAVSLAKKDDEQAHRIMRQFEKRMKTYPYSGEIETEKELMEIAEKKLRVMEEG